MFLTRMQLNPARRGTRRLISSPHTIHAAVLAAYSDPRPSADGRVLWRLDQYENGKKLLLYVVSPEKPDFTHVIEQAGWPTTHAWETRSYAELLDSLRAGQRWSFRLTANPTHAVRKEGMDDTKPLAHVTVDQQLRWLVDRAVGLGFRIVPAIVGADDGDPDLVVVDRDVRRFKRRRSTVTIATATFEGTAEVIDGDALRRCLTHGIGRAKAYGCGLLTLARPAGRIRHE